MGKGGLLRNAFSTFLFSCQTWDEVNWVLACLSLFLCSFSYPGNHLYTFASHFTKYGIFFFLTRFWMVAATFLRVQIYWVISPCKNFLVSQHCIIPTILYGSTRYGCIANYCEGKGICGNKMQWLLKLLCDFIEDVKESKSSTLLYTPEVYISMVS